MDQLHKRFSIEQVKVLLQGYLQGTIERKEVEEVLQISKTRFFELLKEYRRDPDSFSIEYERTTPAHLSAEVEAAIAEELLREKALVEDPALPIWDYNYSALRDRLGSYPGGSKRDADLWIPCAILRRQSAGLPLRPKPG